MTRVLVVDDEIDTLNLLRTILEISGYEAFTTLNSLDALTLAEVERPDLILLDIMMPNLDGFTLCKMMRNHPTTKDLPIVFVTAYSALDLEDRRADAGADMVLPKPIGMDTLIDAVDKATSMRKVGSVPVVNAATGGVIMISLDDKPVIETPAGTPAAPVPVSAPIPAQPVTPAPPTTSPTPAASTTNAAPAAPASSTAPATKPAGSDDVTFSIGGEPDKAADKLATQQTQAIPAAPTTPPTPSQPPVSPDKPTSDTAQSPEPTNKPLP